MTVIPRVFHEKTRALILVFLNKLHPMITNLHRNIATLFITIIALSRRLKIQLEWQLCLVYFDLNSNTLKSFYVVKQN